MSDRPLLSVCIPAYNRAALLSPLLESILEQDFLDYEILICEDMSPERGDISRVALSFKGQFPGRIRYEENAINLGYDGNLRNMISLAKGKYCVFMGNDDLMCSGALRRIARAVCENADVGVVVRSYASFEESPDRPKQVFRYFPDELVVPAGREAVAIAYRRSVVISGMVVDRDLAHSYATNIFDGTLLYQLYLVGMLLASRQVVFVPEVIALRRDGMLPDFGNSASERGKFVPRDQTAESSLHFMQGMLAIAQYVDAQTRLNVFAAIRADIGNYSYPILAIQVHRGRWVFFQYGIGLAKLGLWRYPLFHLYFVSLLVFGPTWADATVAWVKKRLGYTPRFGAAKGRNS